MHKNGKKINERKRKKKNERNKTLVTQTNAGPSGRSPAEIVGSNSTWGMEVCLL
jgi:hypothetical protein